MNIFLTGDVHHMSMNSEDQKYLKGTEIDAAISYAELANRYNIKVTLLLTGKSIKEEPKKAKELSGLSNVEIGGHSYNAFKPNWLYNGIFSKILRRSNGPAFIQNYEINMVKRITKNILDQPVKVWRNHSFRHDRNTYRLLEKNGIEVVSDKRDPRAIAPYQELTHLLQAPINTMPDHDHMIHGEISETFYEERDPSSNPFPHEVYTPENWLEKVIESIRSIKERADFGVLLVHPACMEISDGFQVFEKLCSFVSNFNTFFLGEVPKKHKED